MQNAPSLMTMMTELVGTPSVSSSDLGWDQSNTAVIEKLDSWLSALGFSTEVVPVPGKAGKANLIATLGSGPGGLVLAGHTDTVPYDPSHWSSDPFKLTERDSRFYGLGSCDMKVFLALAIEAARSFVDQPLQQPLIILATADEETGMSGAKAIAELGRPKARYAVIGEPTSMQPIYMHKGIMMQRVKVQGQAGHSSNPALGNSALEAMHEVMGELMAFRREMQTAHQNDAFKVVVPTMNLGCIHGGDSPNRICGQCHLDFDLRALPGMDSQALLEDINTRLQRVAQRYETAIDMQPLMPVINPFQNQVNSELVQLAEKLTGNHPGTVAFGTEGAFLQGMGMDTIVMGPGSIDQAHQSDEYIDMSYLNPTVDVLKQMIRHCCL